MQVCIQGMHWSALQVNADVPPLRGLPTSSAYTKRCARRTHPVIADYSRTAPHTPRQASHLESDHSDPPSRRMIALVA